MHLAFVLSQFDYSLRRKGLEKMIAVVMEKACRNPKDWTGTVGGKLGGMLYIDLTGDDDSSFNGGMHSAAIVFRLAISAAC